ncbi:peptide-N(4)-(N-acetyl-beta-glucosaminyl)asparagine amidase [Scheffersomyces amazonensis]|uniref:peptide-N(4)-(N-acetyl-beta- glucosaminyl)asparagine amidase n=1 Tax=Scheffersomyces amazonensis TaxID=1078765 RepID=UPI00315C7722
MSLKEQYQQVAEKLIESYTIEYVTSSIRKYSKNTPRNQTSSLYQHVTVMMNTVSKYRNNTEGLDKVLEVIDLPQIYANVDKREKEQEISGIGYEDILVQELLHYFKNDFFKWVNKPHCPSCHNSDESKIESLGVATYPANIPNPHEITRIEKYRCLVCHNSVEFSRMNNPISLLTTREGRCGEWVNCFMLILQSLLGVNEFEDRLRYVWNYEDHVWIEYYSKSLKRWIHLDPCEAVYDEPHLYCSNWGKQMSYVIGFNDTYMIDLSSKYIIPDKQIDQKSIVPSPDHFKEYMAYLNYLKLIETYKKIEKCSLSVSQKIIKLYYSRILPMNQELKALRELNVVPSKTIANELPKGRQTGSKQWTHERGEGG